MNSLPRHVVVFAIVPVLLSIAGCAAPSGSYILDPANGARRIDPASIGDGRVVYHLARRDVLAVQIHPRDPGSTATRIERGNHLNIAFEPVNAASAQYRLLPGDELALDFGEDADRIFESRIGPDGNLALPRIARSVRAEGMTIAELDNATRKLYAELYLAPKPAWSVRRSAIDALATRSGEYPVGSDGTVVVPAIGRFAVLGKTVDQAEAAISAQASKHLHNTVWASVSLAAVNGREQIDTRLTPDGVAMYTNGASAPSRISDEGTIFIPGIGQLTAAGRTVVQLRDEIADIAQRQYQNPVIVNVTVLDFVNDAVFIGGEVRQPGRVAYAERLSLLKLIAQAGWATEFGDLGNILLLRETDPGTYVVYRTNLQEVMDGKGPGAQDLHLTPQDIVIVPPTSVAKADRFVSQYLRGLLPFGTNLSYSINKGLDVVR